MIMSRMKKTAFFLLCLFLFCLCKNNMAFSQKIPKIPSVIPGTFSLLLSDDPVLFFFLDEFKIGNPSGWLIVNDSGKPSSWYIEDNKYIQANNVNEFEESYHLGSFVYYNDSDAFNRSNYRAEAKIRSLRPISGFSESIGMMVRYINKDNYLRILISKSQGFVRLEKKVGGVFSTLAFNGRPPALGSIIDVNAHVLDNQIFVYINNEPVFSASDPDMGSGAALAKGTIALFTYSPAEFHNILLGQVDSVPRLIISEPMAYSVFSTDDNAPPHEINVSARAVNVPSGGGVQFVLDNGTPCNDFTVPYSTSACPGGAGFANVSQGEHRVDAKIINSSGQPIMDASARDRDTNTNIGIAGKYLIMFGDSITNGVGDDSNNPAIGTQNDSANGKNLNRGIAPVLNDLISTRVSGPVVVYNEGLGGTISSQGLNRLQSTIERHKKGQLEETIWLILFGTNDSSWSTPIKPATFKTTMNNIILEIKTNGGIAILGKVPYVIGASPQRIEAIQKYNIAIDELTIQHELPASPPDFYNHFLNNPSELIDDVHPNGIGYGSMAKMWFCTLIPDIIPGSKPAYCDNY